VLVKIYGRRGESLETLQREKAKLESISSTFNMVKNSSLIPFKVILTERAAFLVRQYFAHNLCERLGTRPFLSALEKRWILFQLLKVNDLRVELREKRSHVLYSAGKNTGQNERLDSQVCQGIGSVSSLGHFARGCDDRKRVVDDLGTRIFG
jgi:hypothetical protein